MEKTGYEKIIAYFEEENGLENLLKDYKDTFNMIESIGNDFLQDMVSTITEYKERLNKLTGAYMALEPLYSLAEAHKLNEENREYVNRKETIEKTGAKVISAAIEKEASLAVANFRRIRNILEGYVLSCEKGIVTCQTQMKRKEEDNNFKPHE